MTAEDYWDLAATARAAADKEALPQRKQQHLRCAERWEETAMRADETRTRKVTNANEQKLRPYHSRTALEAEQ